ncbi:MAG: 4-aminobutyrate--2-oxoglutarate transaminase [Micrococcales bacterium]|nr:4-aminobutyrate--2-oxoglutarate transaminase [Micrococcales bacterium]NBR54639.1 4-aminobutyrate--2-oxoglutarate transaminase [Micrococcales bacterium]NBR60992.1 4-aminobutyrate--2-oxoglutarate transaminase [Actinomycetota bacterium]NBT46593.1 4-aminobutyrate--2-oxoglutarate transaminase [Actinomycetota bacterium]NBY43611.1 4-aminobutyrate--2-oxoglutarate transaminase [Micrococcales bacterium]
MTIEQKRNLITSIPGPRSQALHQNRLLHVGHGVGTTLPVYIDSAHGAILVDVDGNQLIDMGSGIGVTTIGHTNEGVVKAVSEQVAKLTHTLFTVTPYIPYVEVCEILNRHMPGNFLKRSALFNSGAEAVENAVKLARKFTKRNEIAVFDHAYHGRTNLTMAMNFKNMPYADGFGPFAGSVTHVPMSYPFHDPEGMTGEEAATRAITYMEKRVGANNLAAVVIEPIQGEGGFVVPAPGFLRTLSQWTKANGIVLVADEVQAGIARTGRWFASEHEEGFEPDLMTVAKGIAGGMPISGVIGRAEIMDSSHPGGIGGTFGGNPVAAAAAVSVLKQIEAGGVLEKAIHIESVMKPRLLAMKEKFGVIGEVRGRGAMLALEFVKPGTREPNSAAVDAVLKHCHQNGVVVLNAGTYNNVVRFLPSLAISDELLSDALDVVEASIAAL